MWRISNHFGWFFFFLFSNGVISNKQRLVMWIVIAQKLFETAFCFTYPYETMTMRKCTNDKITKKKKILNGNEHKISVAGWHNTGLFD